MTWTPSVSVTVAGVFTDVSTEAIADVSIIYGRRNPWSQFTATMCSVTLLRDSSLATYGIDDILPGASLSVTVDNGTSYTRFGGMVTDLVADRHRLQLIGTTTEGLSTEWEYAGQTIDGMIGAELFAEYSLIGTGIPKFVSQNIDTGTVEVQITTTASPWINQVLQIVASEPSGTLHELVNGNIVFGDANRRRYGLVDLTLTADEVGLDWSLDVDYAQAFNVVTVTSPNHADYTDDTRLDQGSFTVAPKPTTIDTALKYASDMVSLADQFAYNRKRPLWNFNTLNIPMHALSTARQDDVLDYLEVSSAWQVPSVATGAPTLTFLEGYQERITNSTWIISAYLSDQRLTGQPQQWQNVDPAIAWQDVDAALTWADLRGTEVYT